MSQDQLNNMRVKLNKDQIKKVIEDYLGLVNTEFVGDFLEGDVDISRLKKQDIYFYPTYPTYPQYPSTPIWYSDGTGGIASSLTINTSDNFSLINDPGNKKFCGENPEDTQGENS